MRHNLFDVNTQGRDFVCGDMHGTFDLFNKFLEHVNFDKTKDRMFSVGDLIDRGPKSFECLQLINEPWFNCVKANHEQLMEDYLTGGPSGMWWMPNGGAWWNNISSAQTAAIVHHYLPKIQELPWMITVELPDNKCFHVIHAEILGESDETITDEDLKDPKKFIDIASRFCNDGHGMLWGRDLFGALYDKQITKALHDSYKGFLKNRGCLDFFNPKLGHIYSGHTPVVNPTTICGQTCLDTLAFGEAKRPWAALTFTEPATNTFWKVRSDIIRTVEPTVL